MPAVQYPDWKHGHPAEPIAIVGMGCRFPGGIHSPADFWEFLVSGKSGITHVPADRWNRDTYYSKDRAQAGKLISREGGFIEGIDLFDPDFFGISETEAPYIDPQQRLLLEVTWEAFERAGLVMEDYRGYPVGVFIGCFTTDYLHIQFANHYGARGASYGNRCHRHHAGGAYFPRVRLSRSIDDCRYRLFFVSAQRAPGVREPANRRFRDRGRRGSQLILTS